jgi:HK97 family phage prohead protease
MESASKWQKTKTTRSSRICKPQSTALSKAPSMHGGVSLTLRNIITKFATVSTLSDRQIRAVISDGSIDRVGDIMEPSGCDLSGYNGKNSVILFNHNADAPVANGHVSVKGNQLAATITFPPEGTSATSDEVFKLVKSGVISACSIGFQPDQWELVEPHNRMGSGVRYTKWTLLEVSLVSVP